MRIQYKPHFEIEEATHLVSGLVWSYGEIKDVDPSLTVRVRVDGMPVQVNIVEDLLSNSDYVDVDGVAPPQPEAPPAEQVEIPPSA